MKTNKENLMKRERIVKVNLRGEDTYGIMLDQSIIVAKEKNVFITLVYVNGEIWKQTAEINKLSWKIETTKELLKKAPIPALDEIIEDITGMADWVFLAIPFIKT